MYLNSEINLFKKKKLSGFKLNLSEFKRTNVWLNSETQISTFLSLEEFLLNLISSLNLSTFLNLRCEDSMYSCLLRIQNNYFMFTNIIKF